MEWETNEEAIDDLKKLADDQERLAEESDLGLMDSEELKTKQDSLNQRFQELREELKQPEKKTRRWKTPTQ